MTTDTMLLRQVSPSWVQAGRITSQVFKPTPKDEKRLSAYDGDQVSPADSWTHYKQSLGYESVGVVAVTVGECEKYELPAVADPKPFPEHVVIKFDGCDSNSQIEKKAKHLKKAAETRGWQYEAEAGE